MRSSRMNPSQSWIVAPISFIAAFILTLLPMPDWTVWLRPAWVLMVLSYWIMMVPHRVNIGIAWILGLFLDVLNGTLLGEHALAMVLAAYIVARMQSRMRMFPLLQQGLCIMLVVLIYQFVLFCVQGFIGQMPRTWLFWTPAITSMLLWPWLFSIIKSSRRRYRIV